MYIAATIPKQYGDFVKLKRQNYPFIRFYLYYIEKIALIAQQHNLDVISCIGMLESKFALTDFNKYEYDKKIYIGYTTNNRTIIDMYDKVDFSNKQITLLLTILLLKLVKKFGYSMTGIIYQLNMIDSNDDNTVINNVNNEINNVDLDENIKKVKPRITKKKTNISGSSLIENKTVTTNPLLGDFLGSSE